MNVRAIVLTGFGINCDAETEFAIERAGAETTRMHLNDIIEDPTVLDDFHIFAIPGGFSFGDDVASGKILANRLRYKLGDPLKKFINDGKLVIGICNGFQVMVRMGILPMFDGEFVQEVTLTHNNTSRFEDRWINLKTDPTTPCVWLKDIKRIELPVRNGEGKFLVKDENVLQRLKDNGQIALRYVKQNGSPARGEFPQNPSGSVDDIAGICDPTGRILGLMPHPEAYMDKTNHPRWYREDHSEEEGLGIKLFRNAVEYAKDNLQ